MAKPIWTFEVMSVVKVRNLSIDGKLGPANVRSEYRATTLPRGIGSLV